jgi:hypothetical protein
MSETDPEDILEIISDALSIESWAEGKTLTVMLTGDDGKRQFVKLRFVSVANKPSAADLRGTPE